MADARVVQVAEAVAVRLRSLLDDPPAEPPAVAPVVVRSYGQGDPLDPRPGGPLLVEVVPMGYGVANEASRKRRERSLLVNVVVSAAAPTVPPATGWADGLVVTVEAKIAEALGDPRRRPLFPPPLDGVWPASAEVLVYDPDGLRPGVFVSEVAFDFRWIT